MKGGFLLLSVIAGLLAFTSTVFAAESAEALNAALQQIEREAKGLVPETALNYWMEMQRNGPRGFKDARPLDPVTRSTLEKMVDRPLTSPSLKSKVRRILELNSASPEEVRNAVISYLDRADAHVSQTVDFSKLRFDFKDQTAVLEKLYQTTNPPWYTFEVFDAAEFLGLTALPLNIYGISEEMSYADSHYLTPKQFLYHDELHSIAMIATQNEEMIERKILPGTVEYYRAVLERVKFTKSFAQWTEKVSNPIEKQILRTLWFDAFHDFFKSMAPFRNYYPTEENLRAYIGRRLTSDKLLQMYEKVRFRRNLDHVNRWTPGDFLAIDDPNFREFTPERVLDGYEKLGEFAHFEESRDGDRFWREIRRKFLNVAYMCKAWVMPYEKIF